MIESSWKSGPIASVPLRVAWYGNFRNTVSNVVTTVVSGRYLLSTSLRFVGICNCEIMEASIFL